MKIRRKKIIECLYCGKKINQNREWQKYCSSKCRIQAWDENNPRVRQGRV